MEEIRDIDNHMLCEVDPYKGILIKRVKKDVEEMRISMPVGCIVNFVRKNSFTVLRREGEASLRVHKYRQDNR